MTSPAFLLCNDNLTYDASEPNLCTDEPIICYGPVKVIAAPGPGSSGGGRPFDYSEIFFDPPQGFVPPGTDPATIPKLIYGDELETAEAETSALPWIERVAHLREEIARLRSRESREEVLRTEVDALRKKVTELELELARKPKEITKVVERPVERLLEARSPWAAAAPWFASSAIVGLLTAILAPEGTVRWIGFGASALLAAIGAVELAVPQAETRERVSMPAPTPAPAGPLPIGKIRIR